MKATSNVNVGLTKSFEVNQRKNLQRGFSSLCVIYALPLSKQKTSKATSVNKVGLTKMYYSELNAVDYIPTR